MGIRGFIRNTVDAIRRFFGSPDTEGEQVDHGSVQYLDDALGEDQSIEEATEGSTGGERNSTLLRGNQDRLLPGASTQFSEWLQPDMPARPSESVEGDSRFRRIQSIEGSKRLQPYGDSVDENLSSKGLADDRLYETILYGATGVDEDSIIAEPIDVEVNELVDEKFVSKDENEKSLVDRVDRDYINENGLSDGDILKNKKRPRKTRSSSARSAQKLRPTKKKPNGSRQPKVARIAVDLDILNYPLDSPDEYAAYLNRTTLPANWEENLLGEGIAHAPRWVESVETEHSFRHGLGVNTQPNDQDSEWLQEEIRSGQESTERMAQFVDDPSVSDPSIDAPLAGDPLVDDLSLDNSISQLAETSDITTNFYVQSGGDQVALDSALESLLFVAETPVDIDHLAKILTLPVEQIKQGIEALDLSYAKARRGLRIQDHEDKFQLVTAPAAASLVEDFLSFNLSTRLSGPALEALAIVAYRQPVTRAQVEAVRGVDCASVLRSLIQLGLVEESGRLDTLGRPILYSVTDLFMQHFGLLKMSELPPLEAKEEDLLSAQTELTEA